MAGFDNVFRVFNESLTTDANHSGLHRFFCLRVEAADVVPI